MIKRLRYKVLRWLLRKELDAASIAFAETHNMKQAHPDNAYCAREFNNAWMRFMTLLNICGYPEVD